MTDALSELQKLKEKTSSIRDKLSQRKKAREDILKSVDVVPVDSSAVVSSTGAAVVTESKDELLKDKTASEPVKLDFADLSEIDLNLEIALLKALEQDSLDLLLPLDVTQLANQVQEQAYGGTVSVAAVNHLLHKFALQRLIVIQDSSTQKNFCSVLSVDQGKISAFCDTLCPFERRKRKKAEENDFQTKRLAPAALNDIDSLLSLPSAMEKETKRVGGEILELLNKPTAKEQSLIERFRSSEGTQVREFCAHGTKDDCIKMSADGKPCNKLHFRKIVQKHTDISLGDCSFLNTCFHMNTCKYIHYEVDYSTLSKDDQKAKQESLERSRKAIKFDAPSVLYPPQWIQCDLRSFDLTILGKFSIVMADPPWDIHMELPYGTMSDDEMRQLNICCLQSEGLIFLWVTGRAMELGRECLKLWGYEQCDEIIWVKTNQLQRIIRTGRTGHWLNHGKEHCLVGVKGQLSKFNRGLDCDVIVAEVRATSHKPDEIYGIIERLSPGTRKIELFGRPHNVQPNWITLGNQLDGVRLLDPEVVASFKGRYPDGNCMKKPQQVGTGGAKPQ